MDALGGEDMCPDQQQQWHQRRGRSADPVSQRRDVELDALAGIDRALAVERQMQPVFGEQDMRQKSGAGAPTRDRMRRRRRLGDRLAGPAGELLAHMCDHLPLARDQLQRLGDILAELVQDTAAARARRRRRIDDALARQVLRQRTARRLAPFEGADLDLLARRRRGGELSRSLGLRCILLHIGKLQLELLKHGAAFRGLPEPLVLELGDRELHLLDQQRTMAGFGFGVLRLCLRNNQRLALRQDHRMRSRQIVRQGIRSRRHAAIAAQIADLARPNRALIHNAAFSRPPAAATCVVASASRSLPANIPAAPA